MQKKVEDFAALFDRERLSRRQLIWTMGAALAYGAFGTHASEADTPTQSIGDSSTPKDQGSREMNKNDDVAYGQTTLAAGIRSRFIDNNNGATMHVLEAGFEIPGRPCVVLLHGFPELAYSWRKQMLPLAQAGFYVIAPELRGYGRSSGTDVKFEDDLLLFLIV
jgi:dipeptidyl aminopeptidase/acylaminoacyl peptidase